MTIDTSLDAVDLRAYNQSVHSDVAQLVLQLRDMLGARLVAYLGSVGETRAVRQWAEGGRVPSADVVGRLRLAYRLAALIAEREGSPIAATWFQGMNPQLSDKSPARLIRDGDLEEVGPQVIAAARTFVGA